MCHASILVFACVIICGKWRGCFGVKQTATSIITVDVLSPVMKMENMYLREFDKHELVVFISFSNTATLCESVETLNIKIYLHFYIIDCMHDNAYTTLFSVTCAIINLKITLHETFSLLLLFF